MNFWKFNLSIDSLEFKQVNDNIQVKINLKVENDSLRYNLNLYKRQENSQLIQIKLVLYLNKMNKSMKLLEPIMIYNFLKSIQKK